MVHFFQRRKLLFISVLFFVTCYYLTCSYLLRFNTSPDELMRYLVPKYIYKHGALPSGFDKEVTYFLGNWSYAYYPQLLGALISALFMRIGSFFSTTAHALVFFSRLTSVLFGVTTVAFVGMILEKITHNTKVVVFGMLLTAFFPQFTYLSSYVNNDIIAVSGVSIIVYALISRTSNENVWDLKGVVLLSIGCIICVLGYLNSYGFVLAGTSAFLISVFIQARKGQIFWYQAFKYSIFFCVICFVVCVPFFVRNFFIYNGDFLGMSTFHKQYVLWLQNGGAKLQNPYFEKGEIISLLTNSDFWLTSVESFVAYFGYLTIKIGTIGYIFYLLLFYTGFLGILNLETKNLNFRNYGLSIVSLVFGTLITFGLFIYYAYRIDFQPQGRYIMSVLPLFIVFETLGLFRINNVLIRNNIVIYLTIIIYVLSNIYIFVDKVYPQIMM